MFSTMKLDSLFVWAELLAKNSATICMDDYCLTAKSDRVDHWRRLKHHSRGFFKLSMQTSGNSNALFVSDPCIRNYLSGLAQKVNLGPAKTWAPIDSNFFIVNYYEPDDHDCVSHILLDRSLQKVLVAYQANHHLSDLIPTRVLRAWMAFKLHQEGWVYLHASSACYGQEAVCIVGPKASGKTSTLINLLVSGLFAPISNDKVACKQGNKEVLVKGLPIRAGIRWGTIKAIPELLNKLEPHPVTKQSLSFSSIENKRYLHLYDIALLFGIMPHSGGILRHLIAPIYDTQVERAILIPATEREKRQVLDQQHLSRLGEVVPFQAFFECICLSKFSTKEQLYHVMDSIPMYWLIQNELTNKQSRKLIDGLFMEKKEKYESVLSFSQ